MGLISCCFGKCDNDYKDEASSCRTQLITSRDSDCDSSTTGWEHTTIFSSCSDESCSQVMTDSQILREDHFKHLTSEPTTEEVLNGLSAVDENKFILDGEKSLTTYQSFGENSSAYTTSRRASISLSINYNAVTETLDIFINNCRNLPPADPCRNTSDPYVQVYLLPDTSQNGKRLTKIKYDTLNPNYEERLAPPFHLSQDSQEEYKLWITVWQADVGYHHQKPMKKNLKNYMKLCLGEVIIPITSTLLHRFENLTFALKDATAKSSLKQHNNFEDSMPIVTGYICLKLRFVLKHCSQISMSFDNAKVNRNNNVEMVKMNTQALGSLEIRILFARELPLRNSGKPPKPYCKCCLINVEDSDTPSEPLRQQTPIENSTCNPKWNHTIIYRNFTLQQLKDCCLEITVWDHRRSMHRKFLGGVQLSNKVNFDSSSDFANLIEADKSEQQLWTELLEGEDRIWNEAVLKLRYFKPIVCNRSDDSLCSTLIDDF
ncbi:hypothetical protein B4U79_13196 [Dinothrombium tinctorium]|uniref:C2 domain-containing protein n=1 Tax=Dinothrombium tinctorium TaxID=1965070 RepID=A0A443RP97_9ACAR|nr:hypothetical protein B4U79_13196 [Dinothrombium tinctorium]